MGQPRGQKYWPVHLAMEAEFQTKLYGDVVSVFNHCTIDKETHGSHNYIIACSGGKRDTSFHFSAIGRCCKCYRRCCGIQDTGGEIPTISSTDWITGQIFHTAGATRDGSCIGRLCC